MCEEAKYWRGSAKESGSQNPRRKLVEHTMTAGEIMAGLVERFTYSAATTAAL